MVHAHSLLPGWEGASRKARDHELSCAPQGNSRSLVFGVCLGWAGSSYTNWVVLALAYSQMPLSREEAQWPAQNHFLPCLYACHPSSGRIGRGCRSSENTSPGNRVGAGRVHCCGGVERLHQWELRCCCFYKVKSIYAVVCGNASLDKWVWQRRRGQSPAWKWTWRKVSLSGVSVS